MDSDTLMYVKKTRLTRRESQEATRERLIDAAERAFIRRGFDASSVEQIAEAAGFSRGAFYSNFRSKDELFMAVLKAKRKEIEGALDEIVRRESNPAQRLHAVLDWYVNQGVNRGWMMLETEFTLRACRNRAARLRMEQFNRQRMADYTALVSTHFAESGGIPTGRAEAVAVSLFAAAKGLAELAMIDAENSGKELYAECRDLVFKHLLPADDKDQ